MVRRCRACNLPQNPNHRVPNCSMFSFPVKQPSRCQQWLTNCGLPGKYQDYNLKTLGFWSICYKHFTDEQFATSEKRQLVKSAVPTIFNIPMYKDGETEDEIASILNESKRIEYSPPSTRSLRSRTACRNNEDNILNAQQMKDELVIPDLSGNCGTKRKEMMFEDAISLLQSFTSSQIFSKNSKKMRNIDGNARIFAGNTNSEALPCKICGEKRWDMETASQTQTKKSKMKLLDKINLHLPVKIEPSKCLGNLQVCKACVSRVTEFHEFYQKVKKHSVLSPNKETILPVPEQATADPLAFVSIALEDNPVQTPSITETNIKQEMEEKEKVHSETESASETEIPVKN